MFSNAIGNFRELLRVLRTLYGEETLFEALIESLTFELSSPMEASLVSTDLPTSCLCCYYFLMKSRTWLNGWLARSTSSGTSFFFFFLSMPAMEKACISCWKYWATSRLLSLIGYRLLPVHSEESRVINFNCFFRDCLSWSNCESLNSAGWP